MLPYSLFSLRKLHILLKEQQHNLSENIPCITHPPTQGHASQIVNLTRQSQAGYAVIFLNRRHSIQPFTKGLPSGEIMDTLTEVLDLNGGSAVRVKDDAAAIVHQAVAKAKQVIICDDG